MKPLYIYFDTSMKDQQLAKTQAMLGKYTMLDETEPLFQECSQYKKTGSCKHIRYSVSKKYRLLAETK